jgi:hypothetical protein
MGNRNNTQSKLSSDYSDFCPLRIATLYADIDESINKRKKIDTIIEYFMRPYHGYNIDVLCIQGIYSYKILRELVSSFKKYIEEYNDENRMKYNKTVYLEYYPDVEIEQHRENSTYWSTSEFDDSANYYDKLIISRHTILQSADVQIGSIKRINNMLSQSQELMQKNYNHVPINQLNASNILSDVLRARDIQAQQSSVLRTQEQYNINNSKLMINNNDSDESCNIHKYVQMVNLNVDGTFVSIYNIDLDDDNVGISNNKERRIQIHDIKNIIECNRNNSLDYNMRQFVHGDNTFISTNRDIHIVTGMFHINDIKNEIVNSEYTKTMTTLNAIDMNRWVMTLRKDFSHVTSNIKYTNDVYTLLISATLAKCQDIMLRSQKLFEEHKMVIISSNVAKNYVDLNQFTNYPVDTVMMLYRPNIELFSDRIAKFSIANNNQKNIKNFNKENITTKFMDQMQRSVIDNNHTKKSHNSHPKYGIALNKIHVRNNVQDPRTLSDANNENIIKNTIIDNNKYNETNIKNMAMVPLNQTTPRGFSCDDIISNGNISHDTIISNDSNTSSAQKPNPLFQGSRIPSLQEETTNGSLFLLPPHAPQPLPPPPSRHKTVPSLIIVDPKNTPTESKSKYSYNISPEIMKHMIDNSDDDANTELEKMINMNTKFSSNK